MFNFVYNFINLDFNKQWRMLRNTLWHLCGLLRWWNFLFNVIIGMRVSSYNCASKEQKSICLSLDHLVHTGDNYWNWRNNPGSIEIQFSCFGGILEILIYWLGSNCSLHVFWLDWFLVCSVSHGNSNWTRWDFNSNWTQFK